MAVPRAVVRAASYPGGGSAQTVADSAGVYALRLPVGERYEITAERVGFHEFTADVAEEGVDIRRDLRLLPRVVALNPVEVRTRAPVNPPPASSMPGGREEARMAAFDLGKPLEPGDLGAVAALERGVLALGGEGGLSIGGQPGSQTTFLLDGASFGATTLPADALRSTGVVTSTFDPSRGQFSGGQVEATTLSGTNFPGGVARLRMGHPALQAGDGPQSRLAQASGGAGGALIRDRLFWYAAAQGAHRATPALTLQNAGDARLRSLGVSADSAARFRDLAVQIGAAPERPGGARPSDSALGVARLDFSAGDDDVLMLRLDGRALRLGGVGESPLALAGTGAELRDASGGALAQWTSYRWGGRSELRAYHSRGRRSADPSLAGPAGQVWVGRNAVPGDPGEEAGSAALLRLGGSGLGAGKTRTSLTEVSEQLLVRVGERHRLRAGAVASRESVDREAAGDLYGTFTFASLADLEAGQPSLYTRTLQGVEERARSDYLAFFAGHLWKPHPDLSLTYGLRAEGRRHAGGEVAVPSEAGVSPRAGFTWQAPSRAWNVRGGIGEFRGRVPPGELAAALAETGAGAGRVLHCAGAAAPAPRWSRYRDAPLDAPAACADGTPALASLGTPRTVFADGFAAPRTWRASLGTDWSGRAGGLGMAVLTLDASWIRGVSIPVAWDRRFVGAPVFTLDDEAGRAVWVPAERIDPRTGTVAVEGAAERRVDSRGTSRTLQLSGGAVLLRRSLDVLTVYYTLTHSRDAVGGLSAPGGASEPLAGRTASGLVAGPSDLDRRHLLQLRYVRPLGGRAEFGLAGRLVSGAPYTPRVSDDVNGDGLANDPAFVFDPSAAADPVVGAGMAALLDGVSGPARDCLLRRLGRTAARNGCRAPWSADLDLQANFWRGPSAHDRRFTLTVTASGVLAGADRLLHGTAGARGWGEEAVPDPVLLFVRGFDPASRSFRYEVNPAFGGSSRGRAGFREPFSLVLQGRWTLGSDPIRQPLRAVFSAVRAQGRTPAQLRALLAGTVPNLPAQVLAVDDTLQLGLTEEQKERLRAAADSLAATLGPVLDSLAGAISTVESTTDTRAAQASRASVEALAGRAQEVLDSAREMMRRVLTATQWNRLPPAVQQPSRQILPERGGFSIRTGEEW